MSLDFEKYAAKGNEVVKMLADDLKVSRDKAGRILRAVLHALRNRLTVEESLQLLSQLPMALKSVYVDGWSPSNSFTRIKHLKDFLDEIRMEDGKTASYDFGNDETAMQALKAVLRTLHYFVSESETNNMIAVLPEEIQKFIRETLGEGRLVL
ncbi:DUF2267 domain-containing protein [Segetibacter koreensis]|uniref:DUF2267 domain-containing protein n=1 Tax=Segetibacter koreensis TaxID=398037 RepID=UPI000399CF3F|nr:DUF2267 domain-containing protein [Segetibacter koreensis]